MNLILASVSGLLLIFIFPRFDLYLLAFVALVPLLVSVRRAKSIFEAVICGWICGALFFGGYLFWMNILTKWAGSWATFAWFVLVIFQALFIAAFAGTSKYFSDRFPGMKLIVIPLIWTAFEWLRSIGPYGVTGGGLGYSQTGFLPVLQIACWAGVYGITFLIVMFNEAVTEAILDKKIENLVIVILLLTMAVAFGSYRIRNFRDTGRALNVAVIQANIPQDTKLDYGRAMEIVDVHASMSKKALNSRPDVIIWPETSVTTYLFESKSILSNVKRLVAGSKAYYLIGTPYREKEKIYNSIVAFSKDGKMIGRYDKQRLVPFGEYLPLRPFSYYFLQENPMFAEDYNSDPYPRPIDLGIAKVGAVICFESTFPYLVRDMVKKGAQFLLVATNDAWFFDSAAPYQHIQAAQVRAVESGMYVVQAANTGVSAIIDPTGRIVKRSGVGDAVVLQGRIYVH